MKMTTRLRILCVNIREYAIEGSLLKCGGGGGGGVLKIVEASLSRLHSHDREISKLLLYRLKLLHATDDTNDVKQLSDITDV